MGGGSTTVQAPQPTTEELELQRMQLELSRQSYAEQQAMKPLLLRSMGLREVKNEDGTTSYTNLTEEERLANMSPLERADYEYQKAQLGYLSDQIQRQEEYEARYGPIEDLAMQTQMEALNRQLAAYKGELPVDPALENELQLQEQQLTDYLSQRLGPRWAESTPGIQAMAQFKQKAADLRAGARSGEIQTGQGLLLAALDRAQMLNTNPSGSTYFPQITEGINLYANYPNRQAGIMQSSLAALQPYQNQREMQLQSNIASAQARAQEQSAMWGAVGSAAGMAGAAGIMKWSSILLKDNVVPVKDALKILAQISGVSFNWKGTGERAYGVIAEQVEKVIPEAVGMIGDIKGVDYAMLIPILIQATMEQQRQIDMLAGRA
jgi:hypothetical protein